MANQRSGEPPDMAEQDDGDPETEKVSREKTEQESEEEIQVQSNKMGDSPGEGLPKTLVSVNELSTFCDAWESDQSESFFHFTVSIKEKSYNIWEFMESFEFNHKTLSKLLSLWSQIFESFAKPLQEQETDVSINKCTNTDLKQMSDFAKRIIEHFLYTNLSCDFRRGLHDLEKFKVNTCLTMEPLLNFGGSKDKEESLLEYANKGFEDFCCEEYDFSHWYLSRFFIFYNYQKIRNLGITSEEKLTQLFWISFEGNKRTANDFWSMIQKFSKVQAKTLEEYAQERLRKTKWPAEKWKAMLVLIMIESEPVCQEKWSALVGLCLEFKDILSLECQVKEEREVKRNYTTLCHCYADMANDLKCIRTMKLKRFNQTKQAEKHKFCIDFIYLKIIGIHIFRFGLLFNNANGEFPDLVNCEEHDKECNRVKNDIKKIVNEIGGNLSNTTLLRDLLRCIDSTIRNNTTQWDLRICEYLETLFVNLPSSTFDAIKNHPFVQTEFHDLSRICELERNEDDYGMAKHDANQHRHSTENRDGNLVKKAVLTNLIRAWNVTKCLDFVDSTVMAGPSHCQYTIWQVMETFKFDEDNLSYLVSLWFEIIEKIIELLTQQKITLNKERKKFIDSIINKFKKVKVSCVSQMLQNDFEQFRVTAIAVVKPSAYKGNSAEIKERLLNAANKAYEDFCSEPHRISVAFLSRFFLFYRYQKNNRNDNEEVRQLLFLQFIEKVEATDKYWSTIYWFSSVGDGVLKEYAQEQFYLAKCSEDQWRVLLVLIIVESKPVSQEKWSTLFELCVQMMGGTKHLFQSPDKEDMGFIMQRHRYNNIANDIKNIHEKKADRIDQLDERGKKQYYIDNIYLKMIKIQIYCSGCFDNENGQFPDREENNEQWNQIKNDTEIIMNAIIHHLENVLLLRDILKCIDSIIQCDTAERNLGIYHRLEMLFAKLEPETLDFIKNDEFLKEVCSHLPWFCVQNQMLGDESEDHFYEYETDHGQLSGDESEDLSIKGGDQHDESSGNEFEGLSNGGASENGKSLGGEAKDQIQPAVNQDVQMNGIIPMRQGNANSRRRRNIDRDDVTMDSGNDIHQPNKLRRTTARRATNQSIAAQPDIIEDVKME